MEKNNPSVIHLTPHFYWPQLEKKGWPIKFDAMGGMQTQIFRQVNFLDKLNVNQLVITLKIPGTPPTYKISKNLHVTGKRIPIFPVKSLIRGMVDLNLSWLLGTILFVIKNRNFLKKEYSVIHSHCSGVGIPLLAGFIVSGILNLPLITSIHCSAIATYKPMNFIDIFLHKLNINLEKKVLRKTNHAIFLTEASLNECAKHVTNLKDKATIISDSIDSNYFQGLIDKYEKEDFVRKHNIPLDKPICTYVGRVAREKGWNDIIDLAKMLKDKYHFLIVGDGNEFSLMKQEVKKNFLESAFTFTGYIPQEKVPVAMSLALTLILPSRHEEFGSVLLESMTMGLISVAYNVGGVKKVISNEKDGFLANSLEEMKTILERILGDKLLRETISKNAKLKVKNEFQLSQKGAEIFNIYKKVQNNLNSLVEVSI